MTIDVARGGVGDAECPPGLEYDAHSLSLWVSNLAIAHILHQDASNMLLPD